MRREVIICDICGKEINKGDARINEQMYRVPIQIRYR